MPGIHELKDDNREFFYEIYVMLSQHKHLVNGPPNIFVEDRDRVYLLSPTGDRKYRICGRYIKGLPKCFVCKNKAGAGTEHKGIGACRYHEVNNELVIKKRLDYLWTMLNKEKGMPENLSKLVDYAKRIDQRIVESFDPDIRIMYALLGWVLNKDINRGELNNTDIKLALNVFDRLTKAKFLRKKAESETKLDMTSVTKFVGDIFTILQKHSSQITAQQMMADILKEVVQPLRDKNMIVEDADFEILDLMPKELKNE